LQENDRLLDLLARMDSERAALQRENTQLVGEVVTLRAVAGPDEAGGEGARASREAQKGEAAGAEENQIWDLQQRLQEESKKRQQVRSRTAPFGVACEPFSGGHRSRPLQLGAAPACLIVCPVCLLTYGYRQPLALQ